MTVQEATNINLIGILELLIKKIEERHFLKK